jgi:hypothetical protein
MFKFTLEEKINYTVQSAQSLIKAGWEVQAAITNSKNLYHLSNKSMLIVAERVIKN